MEKVDVPTAMDIICILQEYHLYEFVPSAQKANEILSNYPKFKGYEVEECDEEGGGINITFNHE